MAGKSGSTGESLRRWVRQIEEDLGECEGLSGTYRQRLKELEHENRELKRTKKILKKISAFFAEAELDRGPK